MRRVVTGHDAKGRAVVLMDGEAPHSFSLEKAGGLGEFDADSLIRFIEVAGDLAGNDAVATNKNG